MSIEEFRIVVSESIGEVSAEIIEPASPAALIVLAHGAGANMHHSFMKRLGGLLSEAGIATLRFNFPYMEEARKGRPDPPGIAEATVKAALLAGRDRHRELPIFASGKSFGGRMTSQLASKGGVEFLKGIIFFGFPLHAPGKPSTERASHLQSVEVPMLFHQGTRDTLADITLVREVVTSLPNATLIEYEGADHSFKAGKRDILPEIVAATDEWLSDRI